MYKIRICCSNCYSVRDYEIEHGTLHNEASLMCINCGCSPNLGNYDVMAVGTDYGIHTLKETTDGNRKDQLP